MRTSVEQIFAKTLILLFSQGFNDVAKAYSYLVRNSGAFPCGL